MSRIKQVAAAQGGNDYREFLKRTFELTLKQLIGVEADLTTKEVAFQLKVHQNTVLRYLRNGVFPNAYWINERKAMIPARDVAKLREKTV